MDYNGGRVEAIAVLFQLYMVDLIEAGDVAVKDIEVRKAGFLAERVKIAGNSTVFACFLGLEGGMQGTYRLLSVFAVSQHWQSRERKHFKGILALSDSMKGAELAICFSIYICGGIYQRLVHPNP